MARSVARLVAVIAASLTTCSLALVSCSEPRKGNGSTAGQPDPTFATYVSLAPSNTELVYTVNAQEQLRGVSTQCDFPKEVNKLPRVGSFTSPDLEKLAMLHPEGVLLVSGQEAIAAQLKKHGLQSVLFNNDSVKDISKNVRRLGHITRRSALAIAAASDFDKNVDFVRSAAAETATRPKVFFCVWPDPLLTVGSGSYLNEAITICGGTNIASGLQGAYPHYSTEKLLVEQPDVVILPHEADTADFLKKAPWSSLKAVQQHHVYFLPVKEDDRLSRPTLRLVQGLRWLARKIHPEVQLR